MARWSAAVLLAGLGWSGCFVFDDGDGGGGAGGGSGEAELESVTVPVVAAEGGVAELPDGTALEIPPGALAEDTEITLSRLGDEAMGPEGVLALVQLEPEGLVLQQPVTLTIPFDPAGVEDPGDLEVVVSSAATPPVDRGGETSHYEVIEDAVRSGDAFAVEVQHFSIFSVVYSPQLFVTPAIPGKYLRAGDILYTTTGAGAYTEGSVFPMHVGMFVRGADNDSVIESTLPTPGCTDKKGVQESKWSGDCGFWHLQQQHILVGIRRPSIKATVEDGEKAAAAARSYLGTGYGVVGLSTAVSGMTCVQLAEQAWEKAGFNISYTPDILLTPFNQMQNTTPVRAITVDVKDGEVQIPVVVAVKDGYLSNYQAAGKDRIQAELTLTADLSTPIDEGRAFLKEPFAGAEEVRTLVFQPNQDDVDWSYTFGLEVVVPEHGYQKTVKDFLKISVTGAASGAGPACLLSKEPFSAATAHYRGTMTGTTDPGGDFTYEHPMEGTGNPSALLYQALDGSPWVNLYVSQQPGNGTVMITFPLPGPPQGGVTQVITHPGQIMGTNDFPDAAMWGYMCLLPDGRLFDFSRFDSFDGTAHVTPTEDCSGLVIELQQTDTNWDEKNQDWVSCTYTGTFTGTWCDPMESPGSGCAY